jgi:hypothetical protein
LRAVALCFGGGGAGGLAKCGAAWLSARYGFSAQLGAQVSGALVPAVIYPRVVIGGLWGALFLLPMARGSVWLGGLLFGLLAAAIELLAFPLMAGRAPNPFTGTALLVLLLWLVWGWATAALLRLIR